MEHEDSCRLAEQDCSEYGKKSERAAAKISDFAAAMFLRFLMNTV